MEDSQPSCPPPLPPESNSVSARQWITILHLSTLSGFVIPFAHILIPFAHILAPLIIWLIKKNEVSGLDAAGRSVLNFQISWTLWLIVSGVVAVLGSCLLFPLALPFGIWIAWLIFVIIGAVKASNGVDYKFPWTIRFIS